MNAYRDRTELLGGLVLLYRLDTAKNGNYQYRFTDPYKGKGYIRRSTKTTDLGLACKRAIEAYETAYHRAEAGADRPQFSIYELFSTFINELDASARGHTERAYYIYWRDYFAGKDLYRVSDEDIANYFQWRAKYWSRKNTKGYRRLNKPDDITTSLATLSKEKRYLKWLFRRAAQRKLIAVMPAFPRSLRNLPNIVALPNNKGRGRFSDGDYAIIARSLGQTRKHLEMKETSRHLPFKYAHRSHRYRRACLWFYLLTISNSGIRPQEMRKLRFGDFRILRDEGESYTIIDICPEVSKVGKYRDVVCRDKHETYTRLDLLKREYLKYWGTLPAQDALIFPSDKDASRPRRFEALVRHFHTSLKRPDGTSVYEEDYEGHTIRRTAYSYRAYFVRQRLASGLDVYTLSRLLGTSVEMIAAYYDVSLNTQYRRLITQHIRSLPHEDAL